jgi:hypothetical protein
VLGSTAEKEFSFEKIQFSIGAFSADADHCPLLTGKQIQIL